MSPVNFDLPAGRQVEKLLDLSAEQAGGVEIQWKALGCRSIADTELYVLSRKVFNTMAEEHKKLSFNLMEGIASVLASRLRYTNAELRVLEA